MGILSDSKWKSVTIFLVYLLFYHSIFTQEEAWNYDDDSYLLSNPDRDNHAEISFSGAFLANYGFTYNEYPVGYGFGLSAAYRDFFLDNDYNGIATSYVQYPSNKDLFLDSFASQIHFQWGYEWFYNPKLSWIPYVTTGFAWGKMEVEEKKSQLADSKIYFVPLYGIGFEFRVNILKNFYTGLDLFTHVERLSKTNPFAGVRYKIGFRF